MSDQLHIRLDKQTKEAITEMKQMGFNMSGLVRQLLLDKYHSLTGNTTIFASDTYK